MLLKLLKSEKNLKTAQKLNYYYRITYNYYQYFPKNIYIMSEKGATICTANALVEPDCRSPGTISPVTLFLSDLGNPSVQDSSGVIKPLVFKDYERYYFNNLKFVSGDPEVFEEFRVQLKARYQNLLEDLKVAKKSYLDMLDEFFLPANTESDDEAIAFMQNVINSI